MAISIISFLLFSLVGISVFAANPRRGKNQSYAFLAFLAASWMLIYARLVFGNPPDKVFLIRLLSCIGALAPVLCAWIIGYILRSTAYKKTLVALAVTGLIVAGLTFNDAYIPAGSTPQHPLHGWAFFFCPIAETIQLVVVFWMCFRGYRKGVGLERLELGAMAFGVIFCVPVVTGLSVLQAFLKSDLINQARPVFILMFFSVSAYLVFSKKIMSPGEAYERVLRWFVSSIVAVAAYELVTLSFKGSQVLAVFVVCVLATWLNEVLSRHEWTGKKVRLRYAAAESRLRHVSEAFVDSAEAQRAVAATLADWANAEGAFVLLSDKQGAFAGFDNRGASVSLEHEVAKALINTGPVSEASIERSNVTDAIRPLERYMADSRVGLLVPDHIGDASSRVIVGIRAKKDSAPFLSREMDTVSAWIVLIRSILVRIEALEEKRGQERLATVGFLSTGLAHDMRTPVSTIRNFVEAMPDNFEDPEFRSTMRRVVGDAATKLGRMADRMLYCSSPKAPLLSPVPINEIVREVEGLLTPSFREHSAVLQVALSPANKTLYVDRDRVVEMLSNLVLNALQSFDEGGTARIATLEAFVEDDRATFLVTDTGPGLPPERRANLFTQFATTKAKGIGLGLTLCQAVATAHKGEIRLSQRPGKSTVFEVRLPLAA